MWSVDFSFRKHPSNGFHCYWKAPVIQTEFTHLCHVQGENQSWYVEDPTKTYKTRKQAAREYLKGVLESRLSFKPQVWWGNPCRDSIVIPADIADRIYSILVETCGASSNSHDRDSFIYNHTKTEYTSQEFRFGGWLGFGGKFRNHGNFWSVDCYREDESAVTLLMIDNANTKLQALYLETYSD